MLVYQRVPQDAQEHLARSARIIRQPRGGMTTSWVRRWPCWMVSPFPYDIGSMVLLYMVCHGSHQYTPNVSIYTSTMDPMGITSLLLKPSRCFKNCQGEGLEFLGKGMSLMSSHWPLTCWEVARLSTFSISMVEWIQITPTPQVAPQVVPQVQENRMKGIACRIISGIISGILCMLLVAIQSWMTSSTWSRWVPKKLPSDSSREVWLFQLWSICSAPGIGCPCWWFSNITGSSNT